MRAALLCLLAIGCRPTSTSASASPPASVSLSASASLTASALSPVPVPVPVLPPAPSSSSAPSPSSDWCIDGLAALDDDCCYLAPPGATRLLVYLHGIVPPTKDSVQKQTVEGAVMKAATRANVAALVPRGRRGIGPDGARDWWAWPTSPATHAQMVKEIVARWSVLKKKLEAVTGSTFERTYLAGSSNGAYFLAALALRGDCDELGFPIDGYGVMSGGAAGGRGAEALSGRTPRPVYVGFGTYDPETKAGARALAAVFERARWPVRVAEHPFGHGAREVYLDEAFAFWAAP